MQAESAKMGGGGGGGDCFDKPAIREGRGKGGRGRVWRWLGGQWDGRVRLNHKLASRTADAGRGEIR